MIQCETPVDFHTKRTFQGKPKKIAVILVVVGIVGICIGLALMLGLQQLWAGIFLIFALPLILGLYMMKKVTATINEVYQRNLVNNYLFDKDTFVVNVYENGERIGQSIVGYDELVDVKEDDMFIYMYLNPESGMPVSKGALSSEDLQQLRKWLKLAK